MPACMQALCDGLPSIDLIDQVCMRQVWGPSWRGVEYDSLSGETNGGTHDSGHVKMNGRASNERASSSRGQGDSSSSSSSMMPEEADLHPSSWPPPSQRSLMSHVSPPPIYLSSSEATCNLLDFCRKCESCRL